MSKKIASLVLGVVMIVGAAAGIAKHKSGPVTAIPPTCPDAICPGGVN
jgi:hypothetical protein